MYSTNSCNPHAKVFYRPVDAAMRWCDLVAHEAQIEEAAYSRCPAKLIQTFRQWPCLQINTERIFDAVRNGELPYGCMGVPVPCGTSVDCRQLTIRHTDLKAWMSHYYPDQKPAFLFDDLERRTHQSITLDTYLTLQANRDALKMRLKETKALNRLLRQRIEELETQLGATIQLTPSSTAEPSERGERTLLNIIGSLLQLLLGKSPSGMAYSSFDSQASIISSIMAHYPGRLGITERTLERKFAAAKRSLEHR